ncbi:mitogen-activated protein kinase kinase kinase NPK1-like [Dioscorea cayenensis subsp. rotundata]|uniref:mitogen-activated protein kinase kinase kinase n=1 Tax=Dioscorea cayennensis subsp. rotundata TaxID=55577 RepID=A0AB40B8D5_DIOCR|nr:mitogen-activated protein kinase kinase kinase NPK1-like [Dioscorea cayenensis subsp. rotundata]
MHDLFGSVRKSLVFRPSADGVGIGEKIGSCLRKSRVGFGLGLGFSPKLPAPVSEDEGPPIRWRKGELIGCGAFGQVYMGMNLDSGELLAVKQVLIGRSSAKERAQAHIRELEEEVKLLKNLSHPNIVRYLGTVREEETLNILLEFVPGGSISSLLGKFGSFPESVIKMYSKQLLQGLEYLHQNGIMHRDIKGANILVDNKGCIKLADFGASKQVAKLATMTAAKSMKGTPYWMAPEVILQTGHSFSADIWSVGCTIIEMATGKPPWSQQFQEVAALFHIGTTKSHPPIPEHLSPEAKDFLLKCLQKEPNLRPSPSDLLKHPFVTGEREDSHTVNHSTVMEPPKNPFSFRSYTKSIFNSMTSYGNADHIRGSCSMMIPSKNLGAKPLWDVRASDDMCQLGGMDDFPKADSSFNPMSEPFDDWGCKFDLSQEQRRMDSEDFSGLAIDSTDGTGNKDFTVPCEAAGEDDDEVTETKIRAFLDEKALDLKKLQTPLYEEFFNSLNSNEPVGSTSEENCTNNTKLPPKSTKSPSRVTTDASATIENPASIINPGNTIARFTRSRSGICRILKEIPFQEAQKESNCVSSSFLDRRQKWKEELDQELEMMRQAGVVARTSPKDKTLNRKRDRSRFAFPAK